MGKLLHGKRGRAIIDLNSVLFRGPSIHLRANLFPPSSVGALVGADRDVYAILRYLAAEMHAQRIAVFESIRLSIIQIEVAATGLSYVDAQGERTVGDFVRALHQGLHGQD